MTGKLVYNPQIIATGKTRKAILRRFAHKIWEEVNIKQKPCSPTDKDQFSKLHALLKDNPNYLISRGNKSCPEEDLEFILKIALPHKLISVQEFQRACLIPSKTDSENWCIVQFERASIQEKLLELRAQGINISGSAWGPHISVIRGETVSPELWRNKFFENKSFEIALGKLKISKDGYYWYNVDSPELEAVRLKYNLPPRPSPPFHLTLGKVAR